MTEKKILLVNANKIHSRKSNDDYYLIEYVDIKGQKNKTKCVQIDEWSEKQFLKFKDKIKNGIVEVTGIYEPDIYDRLTLEDFK